MGAHRFPYDWRLADGYPAAGIEPHGCTVFGTFVCGGGSTMGYKLAGFRHLGGVEIDPRAAEVYRANHAPEMLFVEDLPRSLNARELLRVSSFPSDYKAPANVLSFYCGMSVPPVMMAHVASAIYEQWLKPLKEGNPKK